MAMNDSNGRNRWQNEQSSGRDDGSRFFDRDNRDQRWMGREQGREDYSAKEDPRGYGGSGIDRDEDYGIGRDEPRGADREMSGRHFDRLHGTYYGDIGQGQLSRMGHGRSGAHRDELGQGRSGRGAGQRTGGFSESSHYGQPPYGYGHMGYGPSGYTPSGMGGYGPGGYGQNVYGPSGYGPSGYGQNVYGPSGYGQNVGPSGYGQNVYGQGGYGPSVPSGMGGSGPGYGPSGYDQGQSYGHNSGQRTMGGSQFGYGSMGYGTSGIGSDFPQNRGSYGQDTSHRGRGPKNFKRSDERILETVCERLTDDHRVDASSIEVRVVDGEVTLTGVVHDRHTKRLAEDIVEDLPGVKDVQNHIRVVRGEPREIAVDQLNSFLRGELSAVETYRMALEKLDKGSTARSDIEACLRSHEERTQFLREQIGRYGGEPATSSGAWGVFAKIVEGGARALGDKVAIAALEEGEDHGLRDYKDGIEKLDLQLRTVVMSRLLAPQEETHARMSALKRRLSSSSS